MMRFRSNKGITALSPAEAARGAASGELVLVDVREPGERADTRPAASVHVPLGDLQTRLGELPRDQRIAFICRSGGRSSSAARTAAEAGLDVANVRGGMLAWEASALPVDSGPEPGSRASAKG